MATAVIEGAANAGADVLDLGMVGTEMVYFAVGDRSLDGGVMVTASHNPKQYTGMKIVRRGALPVGGESGLLDVRDRAVAAAWRDAARGQVLQEDIWEGFVDRVLSFVDLDALRPLRVVIDAANGMAGVMLPPVLARLPMLDIVTCYFEPDGSFPNHEPNPLLPENRDFIIGKTRSEGADFGVAYDGDADRCFFVDDTGEFVPGDFTTALFAETILAREPGGKVIYDVRASRVGPGDDRAGRRCRPDQPRRACVHQAAHARGRRGVRRRGVGALLLPGLLPGGLGTVPFLLMCELVSRRGKLSEVLAPFRDRYFITGEINTPVADVPAKLRELEERFGANGRVTHLDGLSVDFDDWHFNVRPSNTEPLLRLNLEAGSQELMDEKREEVLAVIRGT